MKEYESVLSLEFTVIQMIQGGFTAKYHLESDIPHTLKILCHDDISVQV